jgi:hypothetical protein
VTHGQMKALGIQEPVVDHNVTACIFMLRLLLKSQDYRS